jgi:hypothetical protein
MHQDLRHIADYLLVQRRHAEIHPADMERRLLPHFFVLDIERGECSADLRLRVRLAGTALDKAFRRSVKGHCLEDFMHGPRSADVLAAFHGCAHTRAPLWMRQVVRVKDTPPRFVEGVAVFIPEERIYGGLVFGEFSPTGQVEAFESAPLSLVPA